MKFFRLVNRQKFDVVDYLNQQTVKVLKKCGADTHRGKAGPSKKVARGRSSKKKTKG